MDLNPLITNLTKMLGRLISEDVELVMELAPELGTVRADPGQLEQVILNLAVNARDAMPNGGRLSIRTENLELLSRARAPHSATLLPGSWVVLTITDTGEGMSPEVAAHAFEPFFTTKERGKGTGLGLPTVYSIVRRNQGHIAFESAPGAGTVFRIYLPRLKTGELPVAAVPAAIAIPGGRETILLAEDETVVRRLTRELLEGQGYTVLEAADGREALAVAHTFGDVLPLLVTDVVMPGLGGFELAREFRRMHPRAAVLFVSGYPDRAPAPAGVLGPHAAFLAKPFTAAALFQKVRQLLDRSATAES